MRTTLRSLIIMVRIPVCAFAAAAGCLSLYATSTGASIVEYLLLAASISMATGSGFLINDYFDVAKDSINKPYRPLPSGKIRRETVLRTSLALFILTVICAAPLGLRPFVLVVINVGALVGYSFVLHWSGVVGNLLTAYLSASTILMGSIVGGATFTLLPAVLFLFCFIFIREIILDLEDKDADLAVGMRTLATQFSSTTVFRFAWMLLGLLFISAFLTAVWGVVEHPVLWLCSTLAALLALGIGIRSFQKQGTKASYRRFVVAGHVGFLVGLLAIVSSKIAFADSGDFTVALQSSESGGSIPIGVIAYLIAGVTAMFYYIAALFLGQINKESKEPLARSDARWRFYSVFGALMLILCIQNLAYGYSALEGFWAAFQVEQGGFIWFLFALGFLNVPVIWLELVYSRNWSNLGFTQYYEENIRDFKLGQKLLDKYYRYESRHSLSEYGFIRWVQIQILSKLVFLFTWIGIYVVGSAFFVHIYKNVRNRELRHARERWFQTAEDVLVAISAQSVLLGMIKIIFPELPFLPIIFMVVFGFLVSASLLIALAAHIILDRQPRGNYMPSLLLFFYAVALLTDYILQNASSTLPAWYESLAQWSGGMAPLVLILLVFFLIKMVVQELTEARRQAAALLKAGFSANLADRALHHLGNLLLSPRSALLNIRDNISDVEGLKGLMKDDEQLKLLMSSVANGLNALERAQSTVREMKRLALETREEQVRWYRLPKLLAPLQERIEAESSITITPQVWKGKGGLGGLGLKVDTEVFRNVMENLVDNAIAAIRAVPPSKPEIEIEVSYNEEAALPLTIDVSDNGSGIPSKHLGRIFDAYFSTKGVGIGLGLFIAKEFMESLEGEIKVQTQTGDNPDESGTTISLRFPAKHVERSTKKWRRRRHKPSHQ